MRALMKKYVWCLCVTLFLISHLHSARFSSNFQRSQEEDAVSFPRARAKLRSAVSMTINHANKGFIGRRRLNWKYLNGIFRSDPRKYLWAIARKFSARATISSRPGFVVVVYRVLFELLAPRRFLNPRCKRGNAFCNVRVLSLSFLIYTR